MEKEAKEEASPRSASGYQPIENYGVIGDLHTVAMVGMNGSIDWCCIPRFDSPSVFGALLDTRKGGFFRIAPEDMPDVKYKQMYIQDTNILITRFLAVDGVGEITDFMPIKHADTPEHQHHIIRSVAAVRGTLKFTMQCRPAFNYARDEHTVSLSKRGAIFKSKSLSLGLTSPEPLEEDGKGGVRATFVLQEGQSARFM
ncbi:MAG TPA: trehalase-like domain-containing protein, partial [Ktedonobacteraceae bacterium]|nr:trehalase-like domain-containing protein [Ktedonobacteraceae bacterium]